MHTQDTQDTSSNLDVAVVGMAGRFPGANNLDEFWENLKLGIESIRFYSDDEVIESGIFPEMTRDPNFVPAAGGIDHEYDFDAEFFDFNPREAEITDPQQRIALECAWEALEDAGYNPETYPGRIGVFAGVSINTYLLFSLVANTRLLNSVGHFQVMTANDKDFLATRIAYKLNLKGPAISVQTACSTGLVAVNLACQSLFNYQSDMVLAGGVSITPKGRMYKEGFIFSKDGHCRAFDEAAQGTVGGNGVGLLVLKRLDDAIADGDHIHAVIKGSAINNDGSLKVGYTAPSVNGQVDVILEAQAMAGVDPDTITYIEAHGTGTLLGDPIEIAALSQAFRTATQRKQYCAIGSVKSNIGHLDTAAGVSGLVKAILAMENRQIPPSLHFKKANPKLNIEQSPFFVNTELRAWETDGIPLRAGVSSFGFGGTNAHTIIEEAPARAPSADSRDYQVLLLSGRTDAALKDNMERVGRYLTEQPAANLADLAYTLQVGRKGFKQRAYLTVRNADEAAAALNHQDQRQIVYGAPRDAAPEIVFMFSGQGSQYVDMGRGLYENEPVFRDSFDSVCSAMRDDLGADLHDIVYPGASGREGAEKFLAQTRYTQPALFAIEYALARLWQSWGVNPAAMIGHSIGEYVAATLAGVFTLADASRLICMRGKLIQEQTEGAMLSVPLAEAELLPLLNPQLSLAAVNASNLCVVSGETAAVDALEKQLSERGLEARRLIVSHAFHSHMLDNAAKEYEKVVAKVSMQPPTLRYASNLSGTWITDEQATSPGYWADHMRQTVRFSEGLVTLLEAKPSVLLEVGPGKVLTTLARQHRDQLQGATLINSTRHPLVEGSDVEVLQGAVGQLWLAGMPLDWESFHHHGQRYRLPLPTYAFQRKRYWLPPVYMSQTPEQSIVPVEDFEAVQQLHSKPEVEGEPANHQAPRDDIEQKVATIWEKMLGIGGIGVHDDFFKLGGHSLLATQLIAEVRNVTDTDVSVEALFKQPTIAGLAEEVRELRAANPDYQAITITVIPRTGKLPLSYHQEMVWDFERQWPGSSRFNGFISLSLKGELDLGALHFAIDEILRRHEVLRTNYRHEKGVNEAIVKPFTQMKVPFHDFSALPAEILDKRLLDLANSIARQPFDLTRDVYIRPVLVKLAAQEHMLLIASHYVAVDGWTIGLVIQEFGSHYLAYGDPNAQRLPELSFQSVDYAAWQRQHIDAEAIDANLPYWRKQLADLGPQCPVPVDRMRGLRPSISGSTYHFTLGCALTEAIKEVSKDQGYTSFMTFVAALNALYHAYSKLDDIVIGTMMGDREIGTEAMIGSLVNLLALRTQVNGNQTFLEVLENVRKTTTDAYSHPIPFEVLVKKMGRNIIRQPLFRTVFILRNIPYTETSAGDLDVKLASLPLDRGVSDMDLTLYLQEKQGEFAGYFEYNTDLFNRSTIEGLANHFITLLNDVLTQPDVPLVRLLPQPAKRSVSASPVQRLLSSIGVLETA